MHLFCVEDQQMQPKEVPKQTWYESVIEFRLKKVSQKRGKEGEKKQSYLQYGTKGKDK